MRNTDTRSGGRSHANEKDLMALMASIASSGGFGFGGPFGAGPGIGSGGPGPGLWNLGLPTYRPATISIGAAAAHMMYPDSHPATIYPGYGNFWGALIHGNAKLWSNYANALSNFGTSSVNLWNWGSSHRIKELPAEGPGAWMPSGYCSLPIQRPDKALGHS